MNVQNVYVPCLQNMECLNNACVSMGLILNPLPVVTRARGSKGSTSLDIVLTEPTRKPGPPKGTKRKKKPEEVNKKPQSRKKKTKEQHEVEAVVNYAKFEDGDHYLVKWKGYPEEDNTWEPKRNVLPTCNNLVWAYHQQNPDIVCPEDVTPSLPKIPKKQGKRSVLPLKLQTKLLQIENFLKHISTTSAETLTALTTQVTAANGKTYDTTALKKFLAASILRTTCNGHATANSMQFDIPKVLVDGFVQEYLEKSQEVARKLSEWEDVINANSADGTRIIVENDVDLEGPPENFTYINDYKPGEGIVIPDDPLVGCECSNCYENRKHCCAHASGGQFAYNKNHKVRLPLGKPIYECNKRCKCPLDCPNRVVQHGSKVKLAIFRTVSGCGWGVKTLDVIKKDSFVMEYVGEVITNEEAEKRGHIYDAQGRTYLFDLDYDDGDPVFTVDAATYGNVSHFMNHSCEPNLAVYGVWINTLDPRLPRIAFFSTRDIRRGEELTFDYMMSVGDSSTTRSGLNTSIDATSVQQKRIPCKCGTPSCRKYLF